MDIERYNLLSERIKIISEKLNMLFEAIHKVRQGQIDAEMQIKLNGAKLNALGKIHGINFEPDQKEAA